MTTDQRDILVDMLENTEALDQIELHFDLITRDLTMIIRDCDDQDFKELAELSSV